MAEQRPDDQNIDKRIDYLKMRLEQTLTHLQIASKQIYLIDGAVLAFGYFVVNAFGFTKPIAFFLGTLSLLLAILNYIHAQFISTQSHWYRQNDKRIRELLKEPDAPRPPPARIIGNLFTSSHGNIKKIHLCITLWLVILSVILIAYASCNIERLPMKKEKTQMENVIK